MCDPGEGALDEPVGLVPAGERALALPGPPIAGQLSTAGIAATLKNVAIAR